MLVLIASIASSELTKLVEPFMLVENHWLTVWMHEGIVEFAVVITR